jgi:hypothetical protein
MSVTLRSLSDDDLVGAIASLSETERTATASLIAHLAELEDRNLHLAQGFKSLFGYCRRILHCSEHESYVRMQTVHAARRFPVILPMLAEGLLHLTAVRLLGPHLEDEDHLALLGGAIHKSKREVAKLLAGWFPSEDVPSTVRKLPAQSQSTGALSASTPGAPTVAAPVSPVADPVRPCSNPTGPKPAVIAPLSADRYRLQITMDDTAHDDLRHLQDAMRREIPSGDPALIVARALALLRQHVDRKAFAATSRPRAAAPANPASRHIPAHVERAVWQRDDGQCSFEGPRHRCAERSFLEFHHLTPWIVGGEPSVVNIALRCRAHNAYESAVYFAPIRAAMADDARIRSGTNAAEATAPAP